MSSPKINTNAHITKMPNEVMQNITDFSLETSTSKLRTTSKSLRGQIKHLQVFTKKQAEKNGHNTNALKNGLTNTNALRLMSNRMETDAKNSKWTFGNALSAMKRLTTNNNVSKQERDLEIAAMRNVKSKLVNTLITCMENPNKNIRTIQNMAMNYHTAPEALEVLYHLSNKLGDGKEHTHALLANHPATPDNVLRDIVNGAKKNSTVMKGLQSDNMHKAIQTRIAFDEDIKAEAKLAFIANGNADSKLIGYMAENASDPNVQKAAQEKLKN
ncbi:hypothetical protein JM93_00323 [Roseibium hamelinense]|uniref:Uncharacterized protein n=1 Tax=Roseibium hamelinense TaxID=150831 RepID=A0A562TGR7_9HYPH|nr:hypothetical protein [Roseibium hamelinense]MTI46034.1 hypothetical protein [Roseibium hamelinense]TWI92775.1 hypothetical protein JM93_00323 [Roseibium hamelinense]